ncbi:MAG: HEAT repeat domain-containing protein [Methanobacteriaceae archaeon]|nr:HEAT repeat domain-containing protein [Methanobacteriaceae archaeon]
MTILIFKQKLWGLNIRKLRHRSNPKVSSTSGFSKCHECGKLIAKSEMIDSKFCKDCFDTISLANKLALKRCATCHEYFEPTSSKDPYHCSECLKKMRRCTNCHKKFVPDGKIILCPVCYSNIVRTCQICKQDFVPKSGYHQICPKCYRKLKHNKKSNISKKVADIDNKNKKTIELLIKALNDPNTQEYATKTLIEMQKDSVEILIESLNNKSKFKRDQYVEVLFQIGEDAVKPLIKALNDEKYHEEYLIKTGCIKVLGLIGDKRAVEPLIELLDDYDSYVRSSSAKSLGLIGDKRAVEPLIELLENDINTFVRKASVSALGKLGASNAINPIIDTIDDDEDPNLTIQCLKSLVEIDYDLGLDYLLKNVDNPNKLISNFSTNFIISNEGEEYLNTLEKKDDIIQQELSKDEFLELVNNLLEDDPDIRMESVRRLGLSGNPRAAKYLVKLINDNDDEIRLEVLKYLGKLKNLETIDSLIKTLKHEETSMRWAAEEALANFGSDAIPKIAKSLESNDEDLRYYLVAILGEIEDPNSENLLIKSLNDSDFDVKLKSIESLSKIGTDKSIGPLLKLLNDDNARIQRNLSYCLIKICQEKDLDTLENTLKSEYMGENKALKSIITKINKKIQKEKEIKKSDDSESNLPIGTILTKDSDQKSEINPYEDISEEPSKTNPSDDIPDKESKEDLGDDPFAILDEITKY